ncbi:2-phospho-L-lactate transferase [Mesorhizobium sp. GR13]|uniref:2-phospho-L-lactate transferase n=1 Tax=Mesorhizobium sp. GR13 TaxID=2562308 RepID=UPI0010C154A1|nr:2-phospho-L-lactate transferase [Mesorhizobium sp. GR13]
MNEGEVIAFSGGVGGAKLSKGLSEVLDAKDITIVVNTGDDFDHLGLRICPDIDSTLYALAGLDDPVRGWGRRDETWTFMSALKQLNAPGWFNLGDGDLATHVERSWRLHEGQSVSDVTRHLARSLGISADIIPMTDDTVRTRVRTSDGWIDFQSYFVGMRCEPVIEAIEFQGAADARPHPDALAALRGEALRAAIICPSNPLLSIDPILAMPEMRQALFACRAPRIAVSPIIAGKAVKGPAAKIMAELGMVPSASAVAQYYEGLIDIFVLDEADADAKLPTGMQRVVASTLMQDAEDKRRLARIVLAAAADLARAAR